MGLVLILVALIAFIVLATSRLKLHPFLALLAAALLAGFAYQVPTMEIVKTITGGFGGILGYIGIVIVLGTIIGVILERSGAAAEVFDHPNLVGLAASEHHTAFLHVERRIDRELPHIRDKVLAAIATARGEGGTILCGGGRGD